MAPELPPILERYFAVQNAYDVDAMAACFAPDALVHDEGHEHRGQVEIRAWIADTSERYRVKIEPLSLGETDGVVIVRARVAGTFPGSPVELDFRFALGADGRIATLEIG